MTNDRDETTRYFLTYRGIGLPLSLGEEVDAAAVQHRGTYFRAYYDARNRMVRCEKLVYGEVELEHIYEYDLEGRLTRATLKAAGDDPQVLSFGAAADPAG